MDIYYVYAYLRESDGTPYYIGKGSNKRAFVEHGYVAVPKDKSKIVFLKQNLQENIALELEQTYIKQYGRIDKGTGILENQTDGGDKPPSQKGVVRSIEWRRHLSERSRGKVPVNKGVRMSDEQRAKISASHKGLKASEETKLKMSQTKRGNKNGKSSWGKTFLGKKHSDETKLKMRQAAARRRELKLPSEPLC